MMSEASADQPMSGQRTFEKVCVVCSKAFASLSDRAVTCSGVCRARKKRMAEVEGQRIAAAARQALVPVKAVGAEVAKALTGGGLVKMTVEQERALLQDRRALILDSISADVIADAPIGQRLVAYGIMFDKEEKLDARPSRSVGSADRLKLPELLSRATAELERRAAAAKMIDQPKGETP